MKEMASSDVDDWIAENLHITLDQVRFEDAEMWHRIFNRNVWSFMRFALRGYHLIRDEMLLPRTVRYLEMRAYMLEFRIKIQMLYDRIPDVPRVPLFYLAGDEFYSCLAFQRIQLRYNSLGGNI